jgi:hypothetical protein
MSTTKEQAEQMAEICDQLGGFAQCATALRSLAAERDALQAENEKLRATLNLAVTAHHEAVNTAISLVAERDTLRAALKECADALHYAGQNASSVSFGSITFMAEKQARAALGEKE